MNLRLASARPAPAVYPDDAGPVAAEVLRLLRLWKSKGACRDAVRLAAPMQFGATRAKGIIQTLDGFHALLAHRAHRTVELRRPDSSKMSPDEVTIARLISIATDGALDEAVETARLLLSREVCAEAAGLAHGLGQMLTAPGDVTGAEGCPFGVPTRLISDSFLKAGTHTPRPAGNRGLR